jgi:hypothetical protein
VVFEVNTATGLPGQSFRPDYKGQGLGKNECNLYKASCHMCSHSWMELKQSMHTYSTSPICGFGPYSHLFLAFLLPTIVSIGIFFHSMVSKSKFKTRACKSIHNVTLLNLLKNIPTLILCI